MVCLGTRDAGAPQEPTVVVTTAMSLTMHFTDIFSPGIAVNETSPALPPTVHGPPGPSYGGCTDGPYYGNPSAGHDSK
jgi:hypothetical protein